MILTRSVWPRSNKSTVDGELSIFHSLFLSLSTHAPTLECRKCIILSSLNVMFRVLWWNNVRKCILEIHLVHLEPTLGLFGFSYRCQSVPHIIEVCSVSFSPSLHHNDKQNLLSSAGFVKQALCHRFDIYSTFIFTVGTTQEHPNDWDFPSLCIVTVWGQYCEVRAAVWVTGCCFEASVFSQASAFPAPFPWSTVGVFRASAAGRPRSQRPLLPRSKAASRRVSGLSMCAFLSKTENVCAARTPMCLKMNKKRDTALRTWN